jgi:MarR family transcriptional regulator for hemolysin
MQSLQNATNTASTADCAREVLDVVPAVLRPIRQHMRRHRAAGLSIPQFRSLCFVERYDGTSLSMVADHLDLSLPTVSRLISGLVQRGYMQRKNSEDDRRHVSLSLRPRGQAVMREARTATQKFLAQKFESLPQDQREALVTAMHALREVFEQEMPHPAEDAPELAEAR